jgi:predicted branched-subunit amino acid permease
MFAQKSGHTTQKESIIRGLRVGIPIAMGYMAVAFSLGIIAAKAGLPAPEGFLSSFFTRASAGEYGTYTLVAVQAAYVEVIAMCLVVNLRYMLMSAALSQKIAPEDRKRKRYKLSDINAILNNARQTTLDR